MDDLRKVFGLQLKKARIANKLSQKDLAKLLSIAPNTIACIERGEQGARWYLMAKIVETLGQPASYYFDDTHPTEHLAAHLPHPLVKRLLLLNLEQLSKLAVFIDHFVTAATGKK